MFNRPDRDPFRGQFATLYGFEPAKPRQPRPWLPRYGWGFWVALGMAAVGAAMILEVLRG